MPTLLHANGELYSYPSYAAVERLHSIANRPGIRERVGAPGLDRVKEIIRNPQTLMVLYETDDAALFYPAAEDAPLWEGHYLFSTLRGREARAFSQSCCRLLFDYFPARAIVGYVAEGHRAARVMSRAIGCVPAGKTVDSLGRSCIRYLMERP